MLFKAVGIPKVKVMQMVIELGHELLLCVLCTNSVRLQQLEPKVLSMSISFSCYFILALQSRSLWILEIHHICIFATWTELLTVLTTAGFDEIQILIIVVVLIELTNCECQLHNVYIMLISVHDILYFLVCWSSYWWPSGISKLPCITTHVHWCT